MLKLLSIALLFLTVGMNIYSQSRTALVIGNKAYKSEKFSLLVNPVHDAQDMEKALQALGFEVQLKLNCSKEEMSKAVVEFLRKLRARKGTGLFYYAGHGVQVNGTNYLIPVKSDIRSQSEVQFQAVSIDLVLDSMKNADLKIVILDACRNNPFPSEPGTDGHRGGKSGPDGLANMKAPSGMLIAFATEPGKKAKDNKNERNGMFTKHLLQHIKDPNTDIATMLRRVRAAVAEETGKQQIPMHRESLLTDFYFNKQTGNDRYEPNDSREQAKLLAAGSYRGLRIDKGDRDWYVTEKAGYEELQVRIEFRHAAGDLDMQVHGPGKTEKSDSNNDNEKVKATGAAGKYWIEVYGYKDAANDYDLTIARRQVVPTPKPTPKPTPVPTPKPTPSVNYGLSEEVWSRCRYQHNGKWLLDMTGDYWSGLSAEEQQRNATRYQEGYARSVGLPVEKTFRASGIELVMRLIPPGRFWMGSPDGEAGRYDDEKRHRVVISKAYWLQKTEITQGQWRQVTGEKPWSGKKYMEDNDSHAAAYISWDDIKEKFVARLGSEWKMPSEAQWEYACRAGTLGRFPWGESESEMGRYANVADLTAKESGKCPSDWSYLEKFHDGYVFVAPVGKLRPNAFGLHDMIGNVWEWCADIYGDYPSEEVVDPIGSTNGSDRVNRGGSWFYGGLRYLRSAFRFRFGAGRRGSILGGRLLRQAMPD